MKHLLVVLAMALFGMTGSASASDITMNGVVLEGLDKVTARVNTIKGRVGETMKFGTLEIVAKTCVTHPPEERPENAAFIEIYETQPGKAKAQLFSGWMFSSSPALSALNHPVYDIWVFACQNTAAK